MRDLVLRRADEGGASRTARSALGFQELLSGDVEGMKRRTRNYAKRQLTWLRRLPGAVRTSTTSSTPPSRSRAAISSSDAVPWPNVRIVLIGAVICVVGLITGFVSI